MRKIVSLTLVMLLTVTVAWSQSRAISGKVTDQNGAPVPKATVNVKNSSTSVAAGTDGVFKIQAQTGDVLVISAVGYTSSESTVGASNFINISLTSTSGIITDVVVTTTLGVQRQAKSLGYSTTKVTGKDLVQAKPINVQNGLTGKVAGLQINTVNNGVLAPTRIVLRGNRSITGNNQALVVVDGAIFYNDLSTLNPDDIADITILKGSSGSVLYGSEGSNGVMVITTKRGAKGAPTVNFTTTTQFETLSYLPSLQTRFGSNGGEAYVDDFNDLSTYIPYENQGYGPEYNGKMVPLGRPVADGSLLVVPYSAIPDQKRDFFDVGITAQNNFSYQSGDDNSRFFLSLQDLDTKGTMPKDKARRDVVRVGGSKTFNKFSANYSVAYTYLKSTTTNTGTVYSLVANTPAHVPLNDLSDWQGNKFADINGYYNDYFDSPWWTIDNTRFNNLSHSVVGNVGLSLQATKWLNLSYRIAASYSTNNFENKNYGKSYSSYAKTDKTVIYSNPEGTAFDTVLEAAKFNSTDLQPSFTQSKSDNFLITSDLLATFSKAIGKDFDLKLIAGTSFNDNKITFNSIGAPALFFPVFNIGARTGDPVTGQNTFQARKLGLLGDATIGYKNWAFLHGSYRTDLDSRLSKDNRWIPYYDIDGSLVLTDAIPSIKNKILSFAKVHAAYSVTGNASALGAGSAYIAAGAYATVPTLNVSAGFPFNGVGGFQLATTIANPEIKPETVTEKEVGIELGFNDNRYNVTVNAYDSRLTDGIVYASVSTATGAAVALVNAANTKNRGIEIETNATVIKSKAVLWRVGINWTHNENEVLSINQGVNEIPTGGSNGNAFAVVGEPYPVIKTRDWVRDSATGKVIVSSVTGLPTINTALSTLGAAVPKDILGFTSSVSWKGFTLSATADYRGGYKIFNSLGQYFDFTGISSNSAATGRQRFVFPNSVVLQDGKYVDNTNITTDDANFNFWPGLYQRAGANYVISAAAWKLREVALSYDLPANWLASTHFIKKATFTLSGRNLVMIRPKTNLWTDPEFNEDTGNDVGRTGLGQSPPSRIYGASLSINF